MKRTKFLEYNRDDNDAVRERYELAITRIAQIPAEFILEEPYRTYFVKTGELFLLLNELWKQIEEGVIDDTCLEEQIRWNRALFSFEMNLPKEDCYRRVLLALYEEIRSAIASVYRCRLDLLTIKAELFLEVYTVFQEEPTVYQVEQALYWHNSDYADVLDADVVNRIVGVEPSYEETLLVEEVSTISCMYAYGVAVTEQDWQEVSGWNVYAEAELDAIAREYIQQYCENCNCFNTSVWVPFVYDRGLESIARVMKKELNKKGIQVVICQRGDLFPEQIYEKQQEQLPWMDRQYKERKLQVLHTQLEQYKEKMSHCLPPIVLCREASMITKEKSYEQNGKQQEYVQKQKKLWMEYFEQRRQLFTQYIPMEKTWCCNFSLKK